MRITVTTPEGALNDQTRKSPVAEIGVIVDDIVGLFEGRLNHWAMLHELNEGGWGGGGQIFRPANIQEVMNIKAAKRSKSSTYHLMAFFFKLIWTVRSIRR